MSESCGGVEMSGVARILIDGDWRESAARQTFAPVSPNTGEPLPGAYPVSTWPDIDAALSAAARAATALRGRESDLARFLELYAERIERIIPILAKCGHSETGLPVKPRLADVELPRTILQLSQAAAAARDGSWALPTIDTTLNVRSFHAPIGPVAVFGPNNFPFAYNGICGGDFAAAIGAGNPVIAKVHPLQPETSRRLAVEALAASNEAGLPSGTVQMLFGMSNEDGLRMVGDARLASVGFTGSRAGGLRLKAAADAAGKPIYLEMSSINPVVILPGALRERSETVAAEFVASCLMAAGQFCTNPGIVLLIEDEHAKTWMDEVRRRFEASPVGTMLSQGSVTSLSESVDALRRSGATVLAGGNAIDGPRAGYANTLLAVGGELFSSGGSALQREAFGNVSLLVFCDGMDQLVRAVECLEGNLTGSIYSAGGDDEAYARVAPPLRRRVGRLLNDKMPTGVAVTPAMQHGGPYPATGHPGFTAVGAPATLRRFSQLQCYDNVREDRLPEILRNANPTGATWRYVDGTWTRNGI